jgi:hypothetical protein
MAKYIVEHEYREPLTDEKHLEEARRADPCLAQYGVKWKATYLATDRLRAICEFEAESSEQIMSALRSADVPFARVWQATWFGLEKD